MSKHDSPRTGDGRYGMGPKLSLRDIIFRRGTKANNGLSDDVQHATTARFRAENGVKPPKKRGRFS